MFRVNCNIRVEGIQICFYDTQSATTKHASISRDLGMWSNAQNMKEGLDGHNSMNLAGNVLLAISHLSNYVRVNGIYKL